MKFQNDDLSQYLIGIVVGVRGHCYRVPRAWRLKLQWRRCALLKPSFCVLTAD